ncbi:GNAT family N-acetyltransferase [Flavobacterium sp. YO64]|uniref:GNAT family N-acetyltransferase n=1 Tax=Flavobacterium sp. YO64 TaxID=394559 RepID=UPI0013E9701B|nr:GNAT family N-acetyltransferase [Flavobacterium sp. YO64]
MRELIRARMYLSRLNDVEPRRTYLITASNNYDQIIGYILYHKVVGRPFDISIISTIVSSEFRNHGIFKNMMNILKNEFSSITLSCFVEKVPLYQKLGFQIACNIQTQIGMYYGTLNDDGQVVSIDEDEIDKIDVVISTLASLKNRVGQQWTNIYNQYTKINNDAISNAKSFVKDK